jgi:hypothetical protein
MHGALGSRTASAGAGKILSRSAGSTQRLSGSREAAPKQGLRVTGSGG